MKFDVTHQEITNFDIGLRSERPHVVILGAGASLAAFTDGDATGRRLPLMSNLAEVVGLTDLIRDAGLCPNDNFERVYSDIYRADPGSPILLEMERRIAEYFERMVLPDHPTLYDLLLLSLRAKDAIFTFNWDPFLVDAFERSRVLDLPRIFHLHGNVRVAFCRNCRLSMSKVGECRECGQSLVPSKLLYPIDSKNYDDEFIATQWKQLRMFVKRAMLVTIFGYSAPTTDKAAMSIIEGEWGPDDERKIVERAEIIDIRDHEELASQWRPFAHFRDHISFRRSFFESSLARSPRRTCEAHELTAVDGVFVEPIPWRGSNSGTFARSFDEIYDSLRELMIAEN